MFRISLVGLCFCLFPSANLAFEKRVDASSQYDRNTKPENAVDGNLVATHPTCVLTKSDDGKQWWYVDLQKRALVFYVKIKNRDDGAFTRGNPFDIRVGDRKGDAAVTNSYCVKKQSHPNHAVFKRFDCLSDVSGQYVSFHSKPYSHMDLCEFEVYGYYL